MTLLANDRDLLESFRRGDPGSLEVVYRVYVDAVETVVRRGVTLSTGAHVFGPAEHADRLDLVQETFARAFSKQARLAYDGIREYRPYLLTICRNLVIDWARRRGREIPSDFTARPAPEGESSPLPWADPAVMQAVEAYLADLPPELTAVHEQRYVLGHSQEQSAEKLGLTRQKVRTLEGRLKKGLRRALKRSKIQWKI